MKYIYIDAGARIGESIDILLEKRKELEGCEVHLFECNPNHFETLHTISNENKKYNFFVHEMAVWVEECEKKFYFSMDKWGDLGCTLLPEKNEILDKENPILVKCVDISSFINNLGSEFYLILKLDVEGAEYEILNHLINTGMINKVKELYVEFHDNFFKQNSNQLKQKLSRLDIKCDFKWM
jgi:FkbM family methyltransferase